MPAPDTGTRRGLATAHGILSALVAGVLAAVVGTLLHAHILYVGDTPLPLGSVLALVFAGALFTVAGLFSEKLWAAGVAGIAAYALVAWFSTDPNNRLLVSWDNHELLPGPALAGAVWTYGLVAATVAALLLTVRAQRKA